MIIHINQTIIHIVQYIIKFLDPYVLLTNLSFKHLKESNNIAQMYDLNSEKMRIIDFDGNTFRLLRCAHFLLLQPK